MSFTSHDVIARGEITSVLANHSRGVDRADFNLLASAYHDDASVDYGFFVGEASVLVGILADAQKSAAPSLHRTSNLWIKVSGNTAICESYVVAYVEDKTTQRFVFGRYLDRLECRSGAWRISHRTYLLDGNTNRANTAVRSDPDVLHHNFVPQGGHGAADAGRSLLAQYQTQITANQTLEKKGNSMSNAVSNTDDNAALDGALSKLAIHDLGMAYCRGVDRADSELLKTIFWEDSTVISGAINGSGEEFATTITDIVKNNMDYCFHSVANEWIDVQGDYALGEHYILAHMTMDGQDVMTGGRYIDQYARRDGVWKIKHRTFVADWNTNNPTTLQKTGFYEGLKNWGKWGKLDPVYDHWASLSN